LNKKHQYDEQANKFCWGIDRNPFDGVQFFHGTIG
jgi:hypothetical protein